MAGSIRAATLNIPKRGKKCLKQPQNAKKCGKKLGKELLDYPYRKEKDTCLYITSYKKRLLKSEKFAYTSLFILLFGIIVTLINELLPTDNTVALACTVGIMAVAFIWLSFRVNGAEKLLLLNRKEFYIDEQIIHHKKSINGQLSHHSSQIPDREILHRHVIILQVLGC